MRDERGLGVAGAARQLTGAAEQIVVGDVTEEIRIGEVPEGVLTEDGSSGPEIGRALCRHGGNVRRQ